MPDSPIPLPVASPTVSVRSMVPLAPLSKALGDPQRWAILRELGTGEPKMVVEIARKIKKPAQLVSKHLGVLRAARIVEIKQRLNFIPAHFFPEPGRRVVDFGHCVLRLDEEGAE